MSDESRQFEFEELLNVAFPERQGSGPSLVMELRRQYLVSSGDGEVVTLLFVCETGHPLRVIQTAPEVRYFELDHDRSGWTIALPDEQPCEPVRHPAGALDQFWASVYRCWPGCSVVELYEDDE